MVISLSFRLPIDGVIKFLKYTLKHKHFLQASYSKTTKTDNDFAHYPQKISKQLALKKS